MISRLPNLVGKIPCHESFSLAMCSSVYFKISKSDLSRAHNLKPSAYDWCTCHYCKFSSGPGKSGLSRSRFDSDSVVGSFTLTFLSLITDYIFLISYPIVVDSRHPVF